MSVKQSPPLDSRRAGILLHPSSLPNNSHSGDLGPEAYHFISFLKNCTFSVWQVLPLVPTHDDGSPYMGLSVLAGNPDLISLELLSQWGWLDKVKAASVTENLSSDRKMQLTLAFDGFKQVATEDEQFEYKKFLAQHQKWLPDFALFMALRAENHNQSWVSWPEEIRDRQAEALEKARLRLALGIKQVSFEQYVFFKQWLALKKYANDLGVKIVGDMPIFVAHDSAEVWANRDCFDLLENGQSQTVAGVPPDYFSATGQLWGNPHYNWKQMKADGFQWWIDRIGGSLELYDLIRVDHFRGFESYWEIDAGAETAMDGHWVKAPGRALFDALLKEFSSLPFIAEDLGVITPQVDKLRNQYAWPGMKILQFAFDGKADNPYLPHNHEPNSVVYTGTHDNDTTLGWYNGLDTHTQEYIEEYLGYAQEAMPWPLIRCALASTANLAVIPMQDILSLGEGNRMNTPGVTADNWHWQFSWQWVDENLAHKLSHLLKLYQRNTQTA